MKNTFNEIFDVEELKNICESYTGLTGHITAIIDLAGKVHVSTDWLPNGIQCHSNQKDFVSSGFYREVLQSEQDNKERNCRFYKWKNGLTAVVMPIFVRGTHIGSFLTGQFLAENPRLIWPQSPSLDFGSLENFASLRIIPVFSNDKIKRMIQFLAQLVETIGTIGLRNLENIEVNAQLKEEKETLSKTNRKLQLIQKTLQENEEKFRSITDQVTEMIFLTDEKGIIKFASPASKAIFGFNAKEMEGQLFTRFLKKKDASKALKEFMKSFVDGAPAINLELFMKHKNGNYFLGELSGRKYNTEKLKGTIGVVRDVTQKRKIEDKLRDKNEQFETIIKGANLGWWDWDIISGDEEYNDILTENLGYDLKDIVPHVDWWVDKIHPDDLGQVNIDLKEHFEGKTEFYKNKHRLKTKSGQWKWFLDYGKVVKRNQKGQPFRMIGTLRDIDYEERAKEKTEEINERLNMAMQATSDGLWDLDLKTNSVYYSPRWKSILGYKDHELSNKFSVWQELTKDKDVKQTLKKLTDAIDQNTNKFEFEFQMQHKEGHWVDILSRAHVFLDKQNKPYRVVGTHTDVTERKVAEKQLLESEERFRKLIENMPSGVAIYKAVNDGDDFEFVDINKEAENITKTQKDVLVGKTLLDEFPNMKNSPLLESLKKVYLDGRDAYIPPFYYEDDQRQGWRENHIYKLQTGEVVAVFQDVSELKEAEVFLKQTNKELIFAKNKAEENEQRFRTVFEKNNAVQLLIDPSDGRIVDANQAACKFYGYSHKELTDLRIFNINQLPAENVKHEMLKAKGREKDYFEFVHRLSDGTLKNVEVYSNVIVIDGKSILISIIHDVTEKRKVEADLRDSEIRFKALHNASFGGIAIHDKGVILECNNGLSEITGYGRDELISMDGLLLIEEDYRDRVMDNILSKYQKPYEVMGVRKNGQRYPLRLEAREIPYRGEKVRVVEFRDITERKLAEDKLKESEERLKLTLEATKDGIWDWDVVKNKVFYSKSWQAILELDQVDNSLGIWEERIHPDDREEVFRSLNAHLAGESDQWECNHRLRLPSGQWKWVKGRGMVVERDRNNNPQRMVGTMIDIQLQKKYEQEIVDAKENLEMIVSERTKELVDKNEELKRFNKLFVGRELRIKELKDKIKALEKQD